MEPILTISILISRNLKGVKRCLESLSPIMASIPTELILTDTGCGNDVRKFIEAYADDINNNDAVSCSARILEFEWIKDFSAARNVGLEEAKRTGSEWFLYVDDDEWFEESSLMELIDFFDSRECDRYNVATYIQRNYLDEDGKTYGDHNVDRILRINPKLHFEHRIHEAYTGIDIGTKKKLSTYVHHYGYLYKSEEERIAKSKRNRELLLLECEEHPSDMRMRHQLMMDYYGTKEYDEAINVALSAIKIKSDSQFWDALHSDILFCCQAKKDWDKLIEHGEKFLGDRLFSYDEFGVRQYLICAYWSVKAYDKVCSLASTVIDTYRDYKKNPNRYNTNQLMRDEFFKEDNIVKMLLFIIDSAIATKNLSVTDKLRVHDIRDDLDKISKKTIYKSWLIQMLRDTCDEEEQVELIKHLPFISNANGYNACNEYIANLTVEAAPIEFTRLVFAPEFFEEEVREGFNVEQLVKNAWAAQLQTLSMFNQICEANNLTYSLDWGSLLGAVRHEGFVPWDDDLDVCMPREDLMKFYTIVGNYPEVECFNVYNKSDWGMHAARLNLSRDFTVDRDKLKDYFGFPFPVGIDIFNIDYVPRDKKSEQEMTALMLKISDAVNLMVMMEEHDDKEEEYHNAFMQCVNEIKGVTHIEFAGEEPVMQELVVLYDEIQSAYTGEDADYVTEPPCLMAGQDYYLPIDTYKNLKRVTFENLTVPIPENYEDVLRCKYGDDYMTPVNTGGNHDYPFFNESIRVTMQSVGSDSFDKTKAHIEKISSGYYRSFINRELSPRLAIEEEKLQLSDVSRIQAALLETLAEIKRLSDAHNISYYYIDGTDVEIEDIENLKGGLVDIHLGMKRMDYMKFQQIIQEELDPWFDYRSIYSHTDHVDMRTYIITDAYLTLEGEYQERFHGCMDIVGIDIAPIDTVSNDDSVEALKKNIIATLLTSVQSMPTAPPYNDAILAVVKEWQEMLGIEINVEGNLQNELVKAADNVAMSDANDAYSRVRISPDIADGNYALFDKSHFSDKYE